jgi:transcriptional regulator with XRE-family HTH domain
MFGDRLKQALDEEAVSPAQFADTIGVNRSAVSHVMNDRNNRVMTLSKKFSVLTLIGTLIGWYLKSPSERNNAPLLMLTARRVTSHLKNPRKSFREMKTKKSSDSINKQAFSPKVMKRAQMPVRCLPGCSAA